MRGYIEKALNVRRDEFAPASLLFLYLFTIIGCYIMGQVVGDAMFLSAYKNYLPHAIMGTAVVVGVFAAIYIRLSHRLRMDWVMIGSLLFMAVSFLAFWLPTRSGSTWVYPFVYMWVYLTGAVGPAMGWTLANYVLTTREARRVFGFIGAGACLGAPVAAFVTADLVHGRHARPETMLVVMAMMLVVCAVIVKALFQQGRQRMAEIGTAPSADDDTPRTFYAIWKFIRTSRYLLLITALIAIGCASTTVIWVQFRLIATDHYAGNKVALAAFFGRFNGYMGIAAFLLQMLLTGHLLRKLGIRVMLPMLPIVLLSGSMAVLVAPVLLTAIILKGSHSLLRFTVDKSTAELLYLPVAPPNIKNQIKSFIDGFVWRTADGLAGVALYFFANRLHFSTGQLSLLNFVFLGTWIVVAFAVRKEYLNVLRRAIERRTLDPEKTAASVLDSTTAEVLALSLEQGGEQQILYGLSLFEVSREPGSHPAMRRLLEHPSPTVRLRALRLLGDSGDQKIVPQVEKLLGDESPEVRAEAIHYLVANTGRDPLSLMKVEKALPDYSLQGSVVAYLARTGETENVAAADFILHTMLSRTDAEAPRARAEAARALAIIPPPSGLHEEITKLLSDADPEVVEQALFAAGRVQEREWLPIVVERLAHPRTLGAARAALTEYGERAIGTLQDFLNDPSTSMAVRRQIPAVLARIATPRAMEVLANNLLQDDPGLRFDILKALNKVRRWEPGLVPENELLPDMLQAELMGYFRSLQVLEAFEPGAGRAGSPRAGEPLLTRALRERMAREMERIFRLLALLYPPQDIYNAYVGIHSGRAHLRANALEVLEHLLPPEIYRALAHALDPELGLENKLRFAQRFCHAGVSSKTDALRVLLNSEDRWMRACALYAVGELRIRELQGELGRLSSGDDPILQETWQWASARLRAATA